jgi:hypothetical protein
MIQKVGVTTSVTEKTEIDTIEGTHPGASDPFP